MTRRLIFALLVVLASCAKKEEEHVPPPSEVGYRLGEVTEPLELSNYFPPNPILFLHIDDFHTKLEDFRESRMLGDYLETKNYEDFEKSRLFRKLELRFKDLGEVAGFSIGLDALRHLAGRETGFALYDIGELQFVYITVIPGKRFARSKLRQIKGEFEERRLDDRLYYVRERDDGSLAFAFTLVEGKLLASNNLRLFEESLSYLDNPTGSLSQNPEFSTLFVKGFKSNDITMWLQQALLNENLYFNNYWIFRNSKELGWIGHVLIDVEIKKDEIRERRILGHIQAAQEKNNIDVGELRRFVPPGVDYFSIETLSSAEEADSLFKREMLPDPDTALALFRDQEVKAAAILIRGKYDQNDFFLTLDKAVILESEQLDIDRLKDELLEYYQTKYVVGGLYQLSFEEESGVYFVNLPLFESISLCKVGDALILGNSKGFCGEIRDSYRSAGQQKEDSLSRLVYIDFGKAVRSYGQLAEILAARPNWRNPENATFFRDNIGSLLEIAQFVETVTITERATEGATFETVVYKR